MKKKVLFILKQRDYSSVYADSYGLVNSARQVAEYLESIGYETSVISVVDSNGIDKVVHNYKPDVVIIEALWVPEYKMRQLLAMNKYKHIKWVVRVHSEIGFLAAETKALEYINSYAAIQKKHPNLHISFNSDKINEELGCLYDSKFDYLPNIINFTKKLDSKSPTLHYNRIKNKKEIDIGCFGGLRILKNQLFQAICAIRLADKLNKKLYFHINIPATNIDTNPVLYNLRELFSKTKHVLVEHKWHAHKNFLHLIKKMDIGMQISYTESFNIVASDFVRCGVPIVVSEAIDWMPCFEKVSMVDYDKVVSRLHLIYRHRKNSILNGMNAHYLNRYNINAKKAWKKFLSHHH